MRIDAAASLPTRVAVACCAFAFALGAHAADPRKVIRDVFPVAETGFDPAAMHDLYSAGIVRAICPMRVSAAVVPG